MSSAGSRCARRELDLAVSLEAGLGGAGVGLLMLHAIIFVTGVYRRPDQGARYINSFVVATAEALPDPPPNVLGNVIATHVEALAEMLRCPRAPDAALLGKGVVVTDARNAAARETALAQLAYRRMVVEELPAAFLLN